MPGVPGVATKTPKRSTERRRTNSPEPEKVQPPAAPLDAPALPAGLNEIAVDWYESLRTSGQAQYYEPSDWQTAIGIAVVYSAFLANGARSAIMWSAIQASMRMLLTTEGERRRARMEVERTAAEAGEKPANVSDIRARLSQGGRRGR